MMSFTAFQSKKPLSALSLVLFAFLLIFTVFCVSRPNIRPSSRLLFFQGDVVFDQKGQKESSLVDVYVDLQENRFRMDLVSSFGRVFWLFLWQDSQHLILLPLNSQYLKKKSSLLKIPQKWQWILKDPQWFRQILMEQTPKGWSCESLAGHKWNSPLFDKKGAVLKKCDKDHLFVQWKRNRFSSPRIELKWKKKSNTLLMKLVKKRKKNLTEEIFNIPIPAHFEQISEEGWK